MRLPEGLDDIERYADFVSEQVADLDSYVLLGDSFGGIVALTFAPRQPVGLKALVLSGGFAANPVINPFLKARDQITHGFLNMFKNSLESIEKVQS
jgi:pimeloyl-ACP methyl ester carboxylesterase